VFSFNSRLQLVISYVSQASLKEDCFETDSQCWILPNIMKLNKGVQKLLVGGGGGDT
jgi:hypothetical protein